MSFEPELFAGPLYYDAKVGYCLGPRSFPETEPMGPATWTRPKGTPGLIGHDFVGASHSALLGLIDSDLWTDAEFRRAIRATIADHGATHNQRLIIDSAFARATGPESS